MARTCLLTALAAAALLVEPGEAGADDTHYQDFVVGGRAVGLGGAFAGLSDDPSGIYYNPAGIADVRRRNLQLSTSLYGFERGTRQEGTTLPVPGVEQLEVQFTDLIAIPASAGFVTAFGDAGSDGEPLQAYGFSVVVPSFRSYSAPTPSTQGDVGASGTLLGEYSAAYSRRVTDRSLWTGVGYARKLGQRLRLGVSAYYVLRTLVDEEELSTSAQLRDSSDQIFRMATNEISIVNGSIVFLAGAKLRLTERIALGLALRTPSLNIHSEANLRFFRGDSIPVCERPECAEDPVLGGGPRSDFKTLTLENARTRTRHPLAVRFGASYVQKYRFTLSLDLSYHAPVSYTLVEVDPGHRRRLPFNPEVTRKGVLNVNAGGEFLVVREVSLAAGFFTNFSSARHIVDPRPAVDQPAHVDIYGFTVAIGYFGTHSLSRIGLVYSLGEGHDVVPANDIGRLLEDQQTFRRVTYSQSFMYVFLSSSFRY